MKAKTPIFSAIRCILIFLLVPSAGLFAASDAKQPVFKLGLESAAIMQYNGTSASKLTPISGLLRVNGEFNIDRGLDIAVRAFSSGGRNTLHGEPGAWVPINSIAMYGEETPEDLNRPVFRLDVCSLRYQTDWFSLVVGLVDLDRYDMQGNGVMNSPVIMHGLGGFVSPHFTRMLALNFTEQEKFSSVPALLLGFRLSESLYFRAGITCGEAGYHFFIRNSGPFELDYQYKTFGRTSHIKLVFGLGDAHESTTHKLSPAAGIMINQYLSSRLCLFAAFSHGEKWERVARLFGNFLWHGFAGLTWAGGRTDPKEADHYVGLGASIAKHYDYSAQEQMFEAFWRIRLAGRLFLTWDFALLHNPAGTASGAAAWVVLPAVRVAASW